jgi:hypothetical protein
MTRTRRRGATPVCPGDWCWCPDCALDNADQDEELAATYSDILRRLYVRQERALRLFRRNANRGVRRHPQRAVDVDAPEVATKFAAAQPTDPLFTAAAARYAQPCPALIFVDKMHPHPFARPDMPCRANLPDDFSIFIDTDGRHCLIVACYDVCGELLEPVSNLTRNYLAPYDVERYRHAGAEIDVGGYSVRRPNVFIVRGPA